jgi:hypothetical protein
MPLILRNISIEYRDKRVWILKVAVQRVSDGPERIGHFDIRGASSSGTNRCIYGMEVLQGTLSTAQDSHAASEGASSWDRRSWGAVMKHLRGD